MSTAVMARQGNTEVGLEETPATGGSAPGITRRSFLKWSTALGASAAVLTATGGCAFGPKVPPLPSGKAWGDPEADRNVWSSCTVNCGSRCPLILQVKDGTITRVLPEPTGDDNIGTQQIRACVRGRSIRHRFYNPDRLKTPLRRKPGTKRGDGQWEEITWEEALDTIADNIKRLVKEYGNESIYLNYGTGVLGATLSCSWPPAETPFARLMNLYGGYLNHYSDYSTCQITSAYPYHYGGWVASNSFDDNKNAKLVVSFGNNTLETRMSGGGETFVTQQTRKLSNVRTIVVDPRYSETAVGLADEWIPIRPGTDTALVAALIYVILQENLQDQAFLDKYCVGFDEATLPEGAPPNSSYRAYVEGKGPDGTAKTPEWAEKITGVPARKIVQLAREIGTAKPCSINQGWGPQRSANGENQARAIFTLAAVTGCIGIPGGGTGAREANYALPMARPFNQNTENPVKTSISVFSWTDAVDHGEKMTATHDGVREKDKLDVPIKMIWQYGGNALTNQHADINRTVELLRDDSKCEFIVVNDIQMTVSARYADIVLPDCCTAEQEDIAQQGSAGPLGYTILCEQAIKPLYNCKPIYEVCTELAKRLGVEQEFTEGRSREDWIRYHLDESRKEIPNLPSYEQLKKQGIYKENGGSVIPLEDFRADPEANPLETPSGKIEIYSAKLAEMSKTWTFDDPRDKLTALPEHIATWEGAEEARTNKKYPLQVIGHHFKGRTHSSYGNVNWLKEAHVQTAWINTWDAEQRGIKNGDLVEVFNDRGRIQLPAKVTRRIAPGVMSVPQGAWYKPVNGVDVGGSVNTLTSWHPSPLAKGNAQHTALVQVKKITALEGEGK